MPYCTITTISESPVRAGIIWVGTDDGKVQLTQDQGRQWTDVTPALVRAGARADRWVSRVFASPFDPATAFVAKNGFRNDDFASYLYRTTDYGRTWTASPATSPLRRSTSSCRIAGTGKLLIVGSDIGVFASIDGGARWSGSRRTCPTSRCTT